MQPAGHQKQTLHPPSPSPNESVNTQYKYTILTHYTNTQYKYTIQIHNTNTRCIYTTLKYQY